MVVIFPQTLIVSTEAVPLPAPADPKHVLLGHFATKLPAQLLSRWLPSSLNPFYLYITGSYITIPLGNPQKLTISPLLFLNILNLKKVWTNA